MAHIIIIQDMRKQDVKIIREIVNDMIYEEEWTDFAEEKFKELIKFIAKCSLPK